jgi:surfeit locus 1 family protein
MRIRFRPLPGLTIATAIMLASLLGLGIWQLERLQWKLALIAHVAGLMAAPAVSLDDVFQGQAHGRIDEADYRRVRVQGRFLNDKEVYVFATGPDGGPVYHVITPLRADTNGALIFVDRGIVPPEVRDPARRPQGELGGDGEIVGILRGPDRSGWFTPPPDAAQRVFYARDLVVIADFVKAGTAFPMFVDADATPIPGGWPKGGQTQIAFRNEHLQYAITWFALALGLAGVYLAYHAAQNRLRVESE